MSCDRLDWLLPALADGEDSAHAHLRGCESCRAAWADTEALLAEVAVGLPLAPAPDLRAAVTARIAAAPAARIRRVRWLPYAAAAALVIGAATLPLNWRGGRTAAGGVSTAALTRHSAPAGLVAGADSGEFEDALIAGAAATDEDSATLETRLFSGAADGLPDLN